MTEDNEEIGPNEDTRPILSKPIWDAIQQAEKNFSHQHQIVQITADTQSERPENKTRAPTYLHLPERLPGNENIASPNHTLKDLENTLKIFAGTNTQSDYHDTTMEPVDVDVLTRNLTPGVHTVTVYVLQPGFCLSAVAVL